MPCAVTGVSKHTFSDRAACFELVVFSLLSQPPADCACTLLPDLWPAACMQGVCMLLLLHTGGGKHSAPDMEVCLTAI